MKYLCIHKCILPQLFSVASPKVHTPRIQTIVYCCLFSDIINTARLHSCLDELRMVLGDQRSEEDLTLAVLRFDYDFEKALNFLLNHEGKRRVISLVQEHLLRSCSSSRQRPAFSYVVFLFAFAFSLLHYVCLRRT